MWRLACQLVEASSTYVEASLPVLRLPSLCRGLACAERVGIGLGSGKTRQHMMVHMMVHFFAARSLARRGGATSLARGGDATSLLVQALQQLLLDSFSGPHIRQPLGVYTAAHIEAAVAGYSISCTASRVRILTVGVAPRAGSSGGQRGCRSRCW